MSELQRVKKIVEKIGFKVGDKKIFKTDFSSYKHLSGKSVSIVEIIDGSKEEHLKDFDFEVLPYFKINLKDNKNNLVIAGEDELFNSID